MAEAMSDERKTMSAADEARAYLSTPPITPAWFGRELVTQLLAEHDVATTRAETAERELADLATELDAANDDADEIAEQRTAYREEIMRLRARVRELETANGERVSTMPTCCNALPAGWIHGANCAALDARDAKTEAGQR